MNASISSQNGSTRPALRFLLVFAALYGLWVMGYEVLLGPHGPLDYALSINLTAAGAAVLRGAGWAAAVAPANARLLVLNGRPAVEVGDGCNGLVLYALFAGFVVAFPGPARHKLWFVPLGVLAVYALNVGRVVLLALNHIYWHSTVEFNHHYTFTLVVYGAIGALWILWARRSAGPAPALALSHGPR